MLTDEQIFHNLHCAALSNSAISESKDASPSEWARNELNLHRKRFPLYHSQNAKSETQDDLMLTDDTQPTQDWNES